MSNYPNQKDDDYNSDGSLTPQGRESFRSLLGLSEEEINRIEEVNMRHVRVEKEQAECEEQHKKAGEEWDRKYEAEKREKERLGIKPGFEVLYVSPDKVDPNSMNPAQRRAYEISGLSIEERLSQGYNDFDDLVDDSDEMDNDSYIPENPPPEIPF